MKFNSPLLLKVTLAVLICLQLCGCSAYFAKVEKAWELYVSPPPAPKIIVPKKKVETKTEEVVVIDKEKLAEMLFVAAKTDDVSGIRRLIVDGVDINARSKDGYNALIFAAAKGHKRTVQLLLDQGMDINGKDDRSGATALFYAAASGHTDVVKLLLELGADDSIRNNAGKLAIEMAVAKKQEEIVKLMDKEGKYWQRKFIGKIAFISQSYIGDESKEEVPTLWRDEIFLFDGNDPKPERLTFINSYEYISLQGPAFSPDGLKIYFAAGADIKAADLYSVDTNKKNLAKLPQSTPRGDWAPSISPAGKSMLFASERDEAYNSDIYLHTEGEELKRMTNMFAWDGSPSFSPAGSEIIFVTMRDTMNKVYTMSASGENVKKLYNDNVEEFDPRYSPDGSKIVFRKLQNQEFQSEIFIANADGTSAEQLTSFKGSHECYPCFSPDGKYIAFISAGSLEGPAPKGKLMLMELDGRKVTTLWDPVRAERIDWSK
ncbi:MAG: ankyrin repeat domain-containing protein [Candidatus Wallbacteria bacterium]|nr:ankyrin repeat domain-containing protein [Candidatus Wallbacteria bacterium]